MIKIEIGVTWSVGAIFDARGSRFSMPGDPQGPQKSNSVLGPGGEKAFLDLGLRSGGAKRTS